MKNLIFLLLTCLLPSCRLHVNYDISIPFNKSYGILLHKYSVRDVRLNEITRSNTKEAAKIISEIFDCKFLIDFTNKDSLYLNPAFGLTCFGDTVFKYTLTKKSIIISNGGNKHRIPYVNEHGIFRLSIKSNAVESISMVPSWK